MGSDAKVDIFFGFVFEEGSEKLPDEITEALSDGEWATMYLNRKKLPTQQYGFQNEDVAEEHSGCIFNRWGWYENSTYFIGVKASHIHGDWEEPKTLDPAHFAVDTAPWIAQLKDFLQVLGIEWEDPKWQMVCSYG